MTLYIINYKVLESSNVVFGFYLAALKDLWKGKVCFLPLLHDSLSLTVKVQHSQGLLHPNGVFSSYAADLSAGTVMDIHVFNQSK